MTNSAEEVFCCLLHFPTADEFAGNLNIHYYTTKGAVAYHLQQYGMSGCKNK